MTQTTKLLCLTNVTSVRLQFNTSWDPWSHWSDSIDPPERVPAAQLRFVIRFEIRHNLLSPGAPMKELRSWSKI